MCRSSRGFSFTNNIDFYVDTTRAPCPRAARNIQIDIFSFIILIPTTNCCCVFYLNRDQQPRRWRVGMCRLNWTQLAPEPAVLRLFLQQSKHFYCSIKLSWRSYYSTLGSLYLAATMLCIIYILHAYHAISKCTCVKRQYSQSNIVYIVAEGVLRKNSYITPKNLASIWLWWNQMKIQNILVSTSFLTFPLMIFRRSGSKNYDLLNTKYPLFAKSSPFHIYSEQMQDVLPLSVAKNNLFHPSCTWWYLERHFTCFCIRSLHFIHNFSAQNTQNRRKK